MQWVRASVFANIHEELLRHDDKRRGIKWAFASLDRAMSKAPKGRATRVRIRRTGETRAPTAGTNRFRGLLIRWERITANYLAMLQLACGLIAYQRETGVTVRPWRS